MKKQALGLIVLLIAFGVWAYFWARPQTNPAPSDEAPMTWLTYPGDSLLVGPQVIYQTTRVKDRGLKADGSDETEETIIYRADLSGRSTELVTVETNEDYSGSVWTEIIGRQLYVHRYFVDDGAWLSVYGEISPAKEGEANALASSDQLTWVTYTLDYADRGAKVLMNVQREDVMLTEDFLLDPAGLKIDGPGYAMPIVVADDGSTVYIREICECDATDLDGLWAYDVATERLRTIDYVRNNDIEEYEINPATDQLIGVSYANDGPEMDFGGGSPSAPSAIHLLDLKTGEGQIIFSSDDFVFGNVFLSPDGTEYASDYRDDVVRIRGVGAERRNSDVKVTGHVLDWIDDTLIIDRDGQIILYNLEKDEVTVLATPVGANRDPDWLGVRYVGVIDLGLKQ